jgi:hypothetical protein
VDAYPFERISGGTAILFGHVDNEGFFAHDMAHFQLYGFGMGRSMSCEVGTRTGSDKKHDHRYASSEVLDLMDALGLEEVRAEQDPLVRESKYGDQYITIRYKATTPA